MTAHEDIARAHRPTGSSDRAFGMVFAVFFAAWGLWPMLRARAPTPRWWACALGATFLIVALTRPAQLAPLNRLWTAFGLAIARVTQPLILGVLYFLVLTPFGLFLRAIGRNPLAPRGHATKDTFWILRSPPGPAPETMTDEF